MLDLIVGENISWMILYSELAIFHLQMQDGNILEGEIGCLWKFQNL
jgi:hypothetical protein